MIDHACTQRCDGCGKTRRLELESSDVVYYAIKNAALIGGWREVDTNAHLCPECIQAALKGPEPDGYDARGHADRIP